MSLCPGKPILRIGCRNFDRPLAYSFPDGGDVFAELYGTAPRTGAKAKCSLGRSRGSLRFRHFLGLNQSLPVFAFGFLPRFSHGLQVGDLIGSFCTKRIDRNWLGKELRDEEEEADAGANCDAAAAD